MAPTVKIRRITGPERGTSLGSVQVMSRTTILSDVPSRGEVEQKSGVANLRASGKIIGLRRRSESASHNASFVGMNREYHKAYSQELHREMEALVFGHAGTPLVVFPTSMGKFFEYEDRGMIGVLAPKIERGELQVFCPDAVDLESWYNKQVHPKVRVLRHLQYERYILHEFLPFVRWKNQTPRLAMTGCSFGAYHALNFALKHPDVVTHCVSMSGAFDIHQFLDGYYDNDCYFNNPPDFLPNQNDDWFLSRYRQMKIVLGSADWDICLDQNVKMSAVLNGKAVPHWLDVYNNNSRHDWPLWLNMAGKYF